MHIRYLSDLTASEWIRPHLHPFAQDVGSLVPEGFDGYARIFHPARSRDGRSVTWRAIAGANGRRVHPTMQFGNIAGSWRESGREDLWVAPPATGNLAPDIAVALIEILRLHTNTPDRCWFGVWDGWGGLDPGTARFEHPNRRYYLASGALEAASSSVYPNDWTHQSPSLWWPDDRAWLVATEIDLDSTYIGATRSAIDAVLAHPRIESLRVRLSDEIGEASDSLNPPPPPRP